MVEKSGDLWYYPAEYRIITTNGIVKKYTGELVMGAGVALQAAQKYPNLPSLLGQYVIKFGNRPFILKNEKIITLPTKYHWKDNSSLELIVTGCKQIVEIVNKHQINSVVMSRPGCGNGRLKWKDVRESIREILDDRFTVVVPYENGKFQDLED